MLTAALGRFETLGEAFKATLSAALHHGSQNNGRTVQNLELLNLSFQISNPRCRVIHIPARRAPLPYLIAETVWQLAQRDDVESLAHYAPNIGRFSSDGDVFTGSAYGARLWGVDEKQGESQWSNIINCLKEDPETRRAQLVIARHNEDRRLVNRDVTCTTSLQFVLRHNRLHLMVDMRSNDILRGMQSDIFFFTVLQELAAAELGCELGDYYHHANIAQIYNADLNWAKACDSDQIASSGEMRPICDNGDPWTSVADLIMLEKCLRKNLSKTRCRLRGFPGWQATLERFFFVKETGEITRNIDWMLEYNRACGPELLTSPDNRC